MQEFPQNPPPPENNLVWAILCTVLCCLPLGIVAIIKATNVNTLWAQGHYDAAKKAANDAKNYSIWGAAVTGFFVLLYILFVVVLGVGGAFGAF